MVLVFFRCCSFEVQRCVPCRTSVVYLPSLLCTQWPQWASSMKENGTTFPNSPFSVQKIFLHLFPSLWYRDDHPRGFTECGHGGLQGRYLISCFFVAGSSNIPVPWCLSNFLSPDARWWELDSQQCCTGARAKEEEQKTWAKFFPWVKLCTRGLRLLTRNDWPKSF